MTSFAAFARSAGFLSPRLTRTVKMTFSRTLISVFASDLAEDDPGGEPCAEADGGAEADAKAGADADADAGSAAAGGAWANADPATPSDAHVTRTANTTFKRW